MTKLILHGELGKEFGRNYDLAVHSPLESIRALSALKPGFERRFAEGNYYIYVGRGKTRIDLDEQTIALKTNQTINIVPAVAGAKKKGAGKLLAGVALMGVAFIPGLNMAAFGALSGMMGGASASVGQLVAAKAIASVAARTLFMGGLTMAMGGAAQLTAPKIAEDKSSNLFSGTPNSVDEGTPVPLVYGEYLAIGYPVSFELTNSVNHYTGGGGGGTVGGGGNGGGGGGGGLTGGWTTYVQHRNDNLV